VLVARNLSVVSLWQQFAPHKQASAGTRTRARSARAHFAADLPQALRGL